MTWWREVHGSLVQNPATKVRSKKFKRSEELQTWVDPEIARINTIKTKYTRPDPMLQRPCPEAPLYRDTYHDKKRSARLAVWMADNRNLFLDLAIDTYGQNPSSFNIQINTTVRKVRPSECDPGGQAEGQS